MFTKNEKKKKRKKLMSLRSQIAFLLLLSMIVTTFGSFNIIKVYAATATDVDGVKWNYTLDNGCATNVYTTDNISGEVVIPDLINNYPVVSIGGGTKETTVVKNGVTSISVPLTVTRINDYAFNKIVSLKDFQYKDTIKNGVQITGNLNYVGNYAFSGCSGIRNVILSSDGGSVSNYAFSECVSLEELNLYSFHGSIGSYAFSDCTSLKELYLGNITNLGDYVFKGNKSLVGVEINYPNLTNQFQDCYNLETIVFGDKVTSVGQDAFSVSSINNGIVTKASTENTILGSVNDLASAVKNENSSVYNGISGNNQRKWYFKNPNTKLFFGKPKIALASNSTVRESFYWYLWEQSIGDPARRTISQYYGATPLKIYNQTINSCLFPSVLSQYGVTEEVVLALRNNLTVNGLSESTIITIYAGAMMSAQDGYTRTVGGKIYTSAINSSFTNGIYYNTSNGYASNNIYVDTGSNLDSSLKTTSDTFSCYPEYVPTALAGTMYATSASNLTKVFDIDSVEIPSYCPSSYKTGIKVIYDGTVPETSVVDPSRINVTVNYNLPTQKDYLNGTNQGVFFIRTDKAIKGNYINGKWSENKESYKYAEYQKYMDVLEENQGIKTIDGMNNIKVDSLPDGEFTTKTNITAYYFTGEFVHVGKGGTYDYDSSNALTPCAYLNQEEGSYDKDGNYIGLGGSYDYNQSTGQITYNILGEYAPIIYKATTDILVVENGSKQSMTATFNESYFDNLTVDEKGCVSDLDGNGKISYIYDTIEKAFKFTEECKEAIISNDMFIVKINDKILESKDYILSDSILSKTGINVVTITDKYNEDNKVVIPVKAYALINDIKNGIDGWQTLSKSITAINVKIDVYKSELISVQNSLNKTIKEMLESAAANETDELKKEELLDKLQKVVALEDQINNLQLKIDSWKLGNEADDNGLTLNDYKEMLAAKKAELATLGSSSTETLKLQLTDLQSKIEKAQEELVQKESTLNALTKLLELDKGYTQEDLEQIKTQLEDARKNADQLNGLIEKYKLNVGGNTSTEEAVNAYIKTLTDKITALEATIKLGNGTNPGGTNPGGVTTDVSVLTAQISTLTSKNATLTSQVTTLKSEKSVLSSENEILTEENTTLKNENISLKQKVTALGSDITALKKSNSSLSTTNKELQTKNDELNTKNASLKKDITVLSGQLSAAKTTAPNVSKTPVTNNYSTIPSSNSSNSNIKVATVPKDTANNDKIVETVTEDPYTVKVDLNNDVQKPIEADNNINEEEKTVTEEISASTPTNTNNKAIQTSTKNSKADNTKVIIFILFMAAALVGGIVFIIMKQNSGKPSLSKIRKKTK